MTEIDARYELVRSRLTRAGRERMDDLIRRIAHDARLHRRVVEAAWVGALAAELERLGGDTVAEVGPRVIDELGGDPDHLWSPAGTQNYMAETATTMAAAHLRGSAEALVKATLFDDGMAQIVSRLEALPETMVNVSANFAVKDAVERVAPTAKKRWQVNSTNPRREHSTMNGETVTVGENFSNGMAYPRGGGPPEQTANCRCSMVIIDDE